MKTPKYDQKIAGLVVLVSRFHVLIVQSNLVYIYVCNFVSQFFCAATVVRGIKICISGYHLSG